MDTTRADGLFRSAHEALRFAFHFSAQQYNRPLINRLADGARTPGKGLAGFEGAAQAGMIRREVAALSDLHQAILIARVAPHDVPCDCSAPCCARQRPNPEWTAAMAWLTQYAASLFSGCVSHYRLRRGIVERYFGVKIALSELAKQCGVHHDTALAHNATFCQWLQGERRPKATIAGVEAIAWAAIETRLGFTAMLAVKDAI